MKILSKIIILFFVSSSLFAQQRFSKCIDFGNYNNVANVLEVTSKNEYIIPSLSVAIPIEDTFGYAKTFITIDKVDSIGNTIWQHSYSRKHHTFAPYKIAKADSGKLLIVGAVTSLVKFVEDTVGSDILLMQINDNGDSLWTKNITISDGSETTLDLIRLSTGSYVLVGQSMNKSKTTSKSFFVRTDANGNPTVKKTFSFNFDTWDFFTSIYETTNNELIAIGKSDKNMKVVKLDSMGNKIWEKTHGNDNRSWYGSNIQKFDRNFIIAGTIGKGTPNSASAFMMICDSLGNMIWMKEYDGFKSEEFKRVQPLSNGKFLAVGNNRSYNPIGTEQDEGWVVLLDANGEIEIEQVYGRYHNNVDSIISSFFNSFKTTSDGGLVIVGTVTKKNAIEKQDTWLLKLDSNGCLVENCSPLTGVESSENKAENPFLLYPNPAVTSVTLSFTSNPKTQSIKIFDMQGKIIYHKVIDNFKSEITIDLSEFQNGLYFVNLIEDGSLPVTKRLMINR